MKSSCCESPMGAAPMAECLYTTVEQWGGCTALVFRPAHFYMFWRIHFKGTYLRDLKNMLYWHLICLMSMGDTDSAVNNFYNFWPAVKQGEMAEWLNQQWTQNNKTQLERERMFTFSMASNGIKLHQWQDMWLVEFTVNHYLFLPLSNNQSKLKKVISHNGTTTTPY